VSTKCFSFPDAFLQFVKRHPFELAIGYDTSTCHLHQRFFFLIRTLGVEKLVLRRMLALIFVLIRVCTTKKRGELHVHINDWNCEVKQRVPFIHRMRRPYEMRGIAHFSEYLAGQPDLLEILDLGAKMILWGDKSLSKTLCLRGFSNRHQDRVFYKVPGVNGLYTCFTTFE